LPCQSHHPWLDHSNYILRRVEVMTLLIMQFSPASYNFIPLQFSLGRLFKECIQARSRLWHFLTSLVFWRGVVSPMLNPQAGEPPPVGCPRMLIEYIRSSPPYLEAVSSIRSLRMPHAVVTKDPRNVIPTYT
jgi:hypothetical protein